MSAITFLILAWVIISWPLRIPPSSRPMMTSTMAISTSVKPFCDVFMEVSPKCCPKLPQGACHGKSAEKDGQTHLFQQLGVSEPTLLPGFRQPGLELLEPLLEKPQLRRVVDPAALQKIPEHDFCRLELVHVLQDEDLHLLRPQRHLRVGGVALHGLRIAKRERQVAKAMLRHQRGVGE